MGIESYVDRRSITRVGASAGFTSVSRFNIPALTQAQSTTDFITMKRVAETTYKCQAADNKASAYCLEET
jgi:hypothetical protein